MNNQNNSTNYASSTPVDSVTSSEYVQNMPAQEVNSPFISDNSYMTYPPYAVQDDGTSKILGILSVIFSAVGLCCCGIQFSVIGVIMGIVAMIQAKKCMQKSSLGLTGVILGAVSVLLYIIFMIAYFSLIISSISDLGGSFDSLF
ncbi:MAG: DUF4190 domain-containing protein [Clostridia bacterium]|nr:DUF4190 domain-containing protein [Clostridia bacterium]